MSFRLSGSSRNLLEEDSRSKFRIDDLPDDILAQVFQWHAFLAKHPRVWALVTPHVCRKWRDITLAHPRLWSQIDLRSAPRIHEDLVHAMLRRSKQAPLSVVYDKHKRALASFSTILEEANNRLRKLRVVDGLQPLYQLLQACSLPQLRSLHMGGVRFVCGVIKTLPVDITRLEELSLDLVMWDWEDLKTCTSLESLTIRHIHAHAHFPRYSLREAHRMLHKMMKLTHLQLLILWDSQTIDHGVVASLPVLESVELGYDPLGCSALLDAMDFPAHASIRLRTVASNVAPDKWDREKHAQFWSPVSRKITRITTPIRTVLLQTDSRECDVVHFHGWACASYRPWPVGMSPRIGTYEFANMHGSPLISLPIPCLENGETVVESFAALPTSAYATNLWLAKIPGSMSLDALCRVCTCMPEVEELHLLSWSLEDVARLLRTSPATTTPSRDTSPVLFPKLRQLVLTDSPPNEGLSQYGMVTIRVDTGNGGGGTDSQPNAWTPVRLALLERMRLYPELPRLRVEVWNGLVSTIEMAGGALRDIVSFRELNERGH